VGVNPGAGTSLVGSNGVPGQGGTSGLITAFQNALMRPNLNKAPANYNATGGPVAGGWGMTGDRLLRSTPDTGQLAPGSGPLAPPPAPSGTGPIGAVNTDAAAAAAKQAAEQAARQARYDAARAAGLVTAPPVVPTIDGTELSPPLSTGANTWEGYDANWKAPEGYVAPPVMTKNDGSQVDYLAKLYKSDPAAAYAYMSAGPNQQWSQKYQNEIKDALFNGGKKDTYNDPSGQTNSPAQMAMNRWINGSAYSNQNQTITNDPQWMGRLLNGWKG